MKWCPVFALGLAVLFCCALGLQAASPPEFDYQGKILVNDIPLTGPGYFKYAIANEEGTTNFWAHDGTTSGEPATYVTNDCQNGVFSAILGGAPMGDIDPAIFALNTSLYLRVWFSSDGTTFDEMLPAQDLLSSPFAINSDMVDGYHAEDIIAAASGSLVESDPVFSASDAAGITAADISDWDAAYGWGDHSLAGYLTSYTETDPVWTAASNSYYQKTEADGLFVDVAGDTMTGALTVNVAPGNDLVISSAGNNVRVGNAAVAVAGGVAVGPGTDGSLNGAAVGVFASGQNTGAAVGNLANGANNGAAMGYQANGTASGAAVGYNSVAVTYGAAVGYAAKAGWYGAALGRSANGGTNGIAIGYDANGAMTNVAIGVAADAQKGAERIALGHNVTNDVDNSARLRGAIYMDGGTAVYGRAPFATGTFQQLLPLPSLENVVYVATNGKASGPGTIDRPFDTPQNAYSYAALRYVGFPAAVVVAAGKYPALNMNAGNIHVIGESRCELDSLTITAPANSIQGKQRVENLIVTGTTIVAADLGEDVKFHNCRFELGLYIYGPDVEVQDCFAMAMDAAAVTVGDGVNTINGVALTQSSLVNDSGVYGTLLVNLGVYNFEAIGCQIMNKSPYACIEDFETGPILPVHLYTHNYLRGMPPVGPGSVPAVRDPAAGAAGPTIAFTQNTVLGHVGLNAHPQFFANNIVYGLINNAGGVAGWTQAGAGTGLDASGNTEHQGNYPTLPSSWLD